MNRCLKLLLISLFFTQCKGQEKPNEYTSSWNQYLGNTKTAHYPDNFILPKKSEAVSIFEYRGGTPSPLIISNDIIYFGTTSASVVKNPTNYIYAIHKNGTQKWKKAIKGNILSSLAIENNILVVVPERSDYIYGLNAINAEVIWKTKTIFKNQSGVVPVVIDNNKVYINTLMVLDLITGDRLDNNQLAENDWRRFTYPIFKDSIMYSSYSRLSSEGGIIASNKNTHKQLWEIEHNVGLKTKLFEYKDTLYAGQKYFGLTKFSLSSHLENKKEYFDTPTRRKYGIHVNNIYYIPEDNSNWGADVNAFDLNTNQKIWSYSNNKHSTELILIGDYLYFGASSHYVAYSEGYIYALHKDTGELHSKYFVGGAVINRLTYSNGSLYFPIRSYNNYDTIKIMLIK